MLNMQILEGWELARYYTPRDDIEAHLLAEFNRGLHERYDATEKEDSRVVDLTEQLDALRGVQEELDALRSVLTVFDLPDCVAELSLRLEDPDTLGRMLAEALDK